MSPKMILTFERQTATNKSVFGIHSERAGVLGAAARVCGRSAPQVGLR